MREERKKRRGVSTVSKELINEQRIQSVTKDYDH